MSEKIFYGAAGSDEVLDSFIVTLLVNSNKSLVSTSVLLYQTHAFLKDD